MTKTASRWPLVLRVPLLLRYEGLGLRVAKKSGTANDCSGGTFVKLYWRGLSGGTLAETDGSGSTTNTAYTEYVFFAGRRIASRVGPSNANSRLVLVCRKPEKKHSSQRLATIASVTLPPLRPKCAG